MSLGEKKGRRRNPINRYSSTLKCGNDCRALSAEFFSHLCGSVARSTPPQRRCNRYCGFFESRRKGTKEKLHVGLFRDFKYFKITTGENLCKYGTRDHRYMRKSLNYSTRNPLTITIIIITSVIFSILKNVD